MEKMSWLRKLREKKKLAKQSTHYVSIWYENNVFYRHIFVTSLILAEAGGTGRDSPFPARRRAYRHTSKHTQAAKVEGKTVVFLTDSLCGPVGSVVDGIREAGPSSLCSLLNTSCSVLEEPCDLGVPRFCGLHWRRSWVHLELSEQDAPDFWSCRNGVFVRHPPLFPC